MPSPSHCRLRPRQTGQDSGELNHGCSRSRSCSLDGTASPVCMQPPGQMRRLRSPPRCHRQPILCSGAVIGRVGARLSKCPSTPSPTCIPGHSTFVRLPQTSQLLLLCLLLVVQLEPLSSMHHTIGCLHWQRTRPWTVGARCSRIHAHLHLSAPYAPGCKYRRVFTKVEDVRDCRFVLTLYSTLLG